MMETIKGRRKMRLVLKRLKKKDEYFYMEIKGLKYCNLTTKMAIKIAKRFAKIANKDWRSVYELMLGQDKQALIEDLYFRYMSQNNVLLLGTVQSKILQFGVYIDKMQKKLYDKMFSF